MSKKTNMIIEVDGVDVDIVEDWGLSDVSDILGPATAETEAKPRKVQTNGMIPEKADDVVPMLSRAVSDILTVVNVRHLIPAIRRNMSHRAVQRAADKLALIARELA